MISFLSDTKNFVYTTLVVAPLLHAVHVVNHKNGDIPGVGLAKIILSTSFVSLSAGIVGKIFSIPAKGSMFIAAMVWFSHAVNRYDDEVKDQATQDDYISNYPILNAQVPFFKRPLLRHSEQVNGFIE